MECEGCSHFLILADGDRDFSSKADLLNVSRGRFVVALDGAVNMLQEIKFFPDVAIGDCDSITETSHDFLCANNIPIIHFSCQNTTDLEKGLVYASKNNALSTVVINALGGRQDHSIGNIFFLKKYNNSVQKLSFLTKFSRILYRENCSETFSVQSGSQCGFFGAPMAKITSRGLLYEMRDYPLEIGVSESISNASIGETFHVHISGSCILTISTAKILNCEC